MLHACRREDGDEHPLEGPWYLSEFVDHSDDPNVRFSFRTEDKSAILFALRPSSEGRELFIDHYAEYHPSVEPTC